MTDHPALPKFGRDIVSLNFKERLVFNSIIFFNRLAGNWKYPVKTNGDFGTMTTRDKIYWLYKSANPVDRAVKDSGLETFFKQQSSLDTGLPANFSSQHEVTITAAGDLMPHAYLNNSRQSLYSGIHELLFGGDIAMANLESCISTGKLEKLDGNPKKAPVLQYDSSAFDIVSSFEGRRYDFLSTACNHSLDLGMEGVLTTAETLSTANIQFHGINLEEEASYQATIIERKNIKIGLVCFSFGLNGFKPPAAKPWLVNTLNLNDPVGDINFSGIEKQIQFCKLKDVDFIIAQLHWGYEFEFYPRPEQVEVAHQLAEMGIDLIIGHHPHVIQPIEYYRTMRDKNRIVPVFYSLGNLVNPFSAPFMCLSYLARISLVKGYTEDGLLKTYINKATALKIRQTSCGKTRTIGLSGSKEFRVGSS